MSFSTCFTVKQEPMNQFGSDDFTRHVQHIDTGDVLEDLDPGYLHDSGSLNRCRTVSTSSVLSIPNMNAYDLYPDIAGIMASSDSESEMNELWLATGDDYLRLEDIVGSPPRKSRQRRHSQLISANAADANMLEMLDTLGFSSRDLSHVSEDVKDIRLNWNQGAAVSSGIHVDETNETVNVKIEPVSSIKNELLSNSSGITYNKTDGIVAPDMTSLLEQFEEAQFSSPSAGTEVELTAAVRVESAETRPLPSSSASSSSCVVAQTFVCSPNAASVDLINVHLKTETSNELRHVTSEQSGFNVKTVTSGEFLVWTNEKSSVGTTSKRGIRQKSDKIYDTCVTTQIEVPDAETVPLVKNKRGRPRKVSIPKEQTSLGEKTVASIPVDQITVSDEMKKRMMEKARAISQAISRKSLPAKNEVVQDATCPARAQSAGALQQGSVLMLSKAQNKPEARDSEKGCALARSASFRIPRVKKGESVLTNSFQKIITSPVSRVAPPLVIEASSLKNLEKGGWRTSESREGLKVTAPRNVNRSVSDVYRKAVGGQSVLQRSVSDVTVNLAVSNLDCMSNSGVLDESWKSSPTVSESASSIGSAADGSSSQASSPQQMDATHSLLRVPSRDMIEKITMSAKRKTTILLSNAVPAHGERGTAVGFVTSSVRKISYSSSLSDVAKEHIPELQLSESSNESEQAAVLTTLSSCSSMSSVCGDGGGGDGGDKPPPAKKKRKLNISQYKSILPERRKALQVAATLESAQISNKCILSVSEIARIISLDHDYGQTLSKKTAAELENTDAVVKEGQQLVVDPVASNTSPVNAEESASAEGVMSDPDKMLPEKENEMVVRSEDVVEDIGDKHVELSTDTHTEVPSENDISLTEENSKSAMLKEPDKILPSDSKPDLSQQQLSKDVRRVQESVSDTLGGCDRLHKIKSFHHRNYRGRHLSPSARHINDGPSMIGSCKDSGKLGVVSGSSVSAADVGVPQPGSSSASSAVMEFNSLPQHLTSFTNSTKYDTSICYDVDNNVVSLSEQPRLNASRDSFSGSAAEAWSRSSSPVSISSSSSSGSSRSRSRSSRTRRTSSCSSCSSCSSSRSRSRYRSRSPLSRSTRSRSRRWRKSRSRSRSIRRSHSHSLSNWDDDTRCQLRYQVDSQQKPIEERRVVYVGKIPRNFTKHDLRRKFQCFGEITDCSVHFRSHGDDYGFVTYRYTSDAYTAIEKGRTIAGCEEFDFCFGGRRQFCKSDYADLDGELEMEEEMPVPSYSRSSHEHSRSSRDFDFDSLLQQAKRQLLKK